MNKEIKSPKLRFKEFDKNIIEKKVKNIFTLIAGGDLDKEDFSINIDDLHKYPIYSNSLQNKGLYGYNSLPIQTKDKLIVTARGTLGKVNVINEDFTPIGRLLTLSLKNNEYNLIYWKELLNLIKIIEESTGVPQLTIPNYSNYKICYTQDIKEQEKIGKFFSKIDEQIEQQENKIRLLEKQKKGLIQKIFSQEIRFKDDDGNDFPIWEEKRFSDIFESIPSKKNQILSNEILKEGLYPVVDQSKEKISGYHNDKNKLFENLPIIIFGDHTTILKYVDFPYIIGADGTKVLKNKELKDNIKFLYYNLTYNNVTPEGYKRHFSILKSIKLNLPNIKEQEKIAQVLSKFDKLIEKEKQLLEQQKQMKKGLLQQMFV